MTLAAADFPAFFHDVHCDRPAHDAACVTPFDWQARLMERVLDDGWPEVIDVPTGLGKTAVVDVALFALAVQAGRAAAERTAPTRVFVAVNRRVIVDQTHEHALRLKCRLEDRLDDPRSDVLTEVARRLERLSTGAHPPAPLAVVRMRGGVTWSWRWLESPAQPAVVTGTVDQYGSRLLFRGYGVGDKLRPIDAALAGTDRLLILDEAHLAWPFVQTAATVEASERRATTKVLASRRPPPVLLSATPPLGRGKPQEVFRLDPAAETSAEAARRLSTNREVRLVELDAPRADTDDHLAQALAGLARGLAADVRRVAVVCNTVALARRTFRFLEEALDDTASLGLLIGRCREIDRRRIAEHWLGRLSPGAETADDAPLIAVTTQTVEVGADIDVGAMVTEAAPIDALLQRLGRLDRRGIRGSAQAVVVHARHRHDGADAAVYGEATRRTWEWLVEQAGEPWTRKLGKIATALAEAPSIDLGPAALPAVLDPATRSSLAAEPPPAPVALGPTLDAWARTRPRPFPDQVVGPFLHGLGQGPPEVLVCWRAGLPNPGPDALDIWRLELETTPVGSHETVSVPLSEAARFLSGAAAAGGADLEGGAGSEDVSGGVSLPAVAQGPDGDVRLVAATRDVQAGDVVVLPANVGGHDAWGWTGEAAPGGDGAETVPDVADLASGVALRGGARRARPGAARLRLRGGVLSGLGLRREDGEPLWLPGPAELDPDLRGVLAEVRSCAVTAAEGTSESRWYAARLVEACDQLVRRPDARPRGFLVCSGGVGRRMPSTPENRATDTDEWWVLGGPRGLQAQVGDGSGDDGDPGSSSAGGRRVDLDEHLRDVERRVRLVAERLGLPRPLVDALALAGLAHDLGKAEPRFQAMLYGGSRDRAEATGRLLAKSGMDPLNAAAYRAAVHRSGIPTGMRHEALSAALLSGILESDGRVAEGLDVDLVHHLVASHHGHARPLLPGVIDSTPEPVTAGLPGSEAVVTVRSDAASVDWEGPSRFKRLGARYGWWGLALLETILRLGDIAVSAEYGSEPAGEPRG